MYRQSVLAQIARAEFSCLHSATAFQALERAEAWDIQAAADLLRTHSDKGSWRAQDCRVPCPQRPLLWLEWCSRSDHAEAALGALCSTRRTAEGYQTEAVVFASAVPLLRYRLTYDASGDLVWPPSLPYFGSLGGGLFTMHGWEKATAEAWDNQEHMANLQLTALAPAILALSCLNGGPQKPPVLSVPVGLQDGLESGMPLAEAMVECGDIFKLTSVVTDAETPPLWMTPLPSSNEVTARTADPSGYLQPDKPHIRPFVAPLSVL